jgi:6,7-dimethyl-8-ribityllumazine synthase
MIQGSYNGKGRKIAIVISRFNEFITDSLNSGAKDTLERNAVSRNDIVEVRVPGALEIPLAVKELVLSKKYNAIIALGAVIRGATAHFDYVAGFTSTAISQIGLDHNIPVLNGVLTVDNIEQAIERSGSKAGNKGSECALAALEMCDIVDQIRKLS